MTPDEQVEAALDDTWHLGRHPVGVGGEIRLAYCGKVLNYADKGGKPLCEVCRVEFFAWVGTGGLPLTGTSKP